MRRQSLLVISSKQLIPWESHAVVFAFAIVLIDAIGFGIVMPVLPPLLVELTGKPLTDSARYVGWLGFSYAGMQFLFSPMLGALSDRFGRRPVLLSSLLAVAIDFALCALATAPLWLLVGRVVAGVAGATSATANASIADVVAPDRRAQAYGLMGAAFGVGLLIGPAAGGVLGAFGPRVPFYTAAVVAGSNLLYGLFCFRETLPRDSRRPLSFARSNPVTAFAELYRACPQISFSLFAVFLFLLGGQSISVWSFYVIDRFHWSTWEVGLSFSAVGLTAILVQGWLIRLVIPRFGEDRAAIAGVLATSLSLFIYGLSPSGWVIYVGIGVSALGDLAFPSIESLMSRQSPSNLQGALQGVLTSISSVTTILGPLLFAQIFSRFAGSPVMNHRSGSPMILGGILVLAAILFLRPAFRIRQTGREATNVV